MAVVESNQVVKAKLVYQIEDDMGEIRQASKTFSNIKNGCTNDEMYNGLLAVSGLLDVQGASVVRVDERELVSE